MTPVSPSALERANELQVKNILAKLESGKTLTARENRMLTEAAAGVEPGQTNYVRTYEELAKRLGCTRRTINNVMNRHPDTPEPKADGRYDVEAWLLFFKEHNISGAESEPKSVAEWKARQVELQCERLEIDNAKRAGQLVEASNVEAGLSSLMAAFRQALNNVPGRLAQKILHLKDYHEAEELIQVEVDVVLRVFVGFNLLGGPRDAEADILPPVEALEDAEDDDAPPVTLSKPMKKAMLPKGKPRGRSKKSA